MHVQSVTMCLIRECLCLVLFHRGRQGPSNAATASLSALEGGATPSNHWMLPGWRICLQPRRSAHGKTLYGLPNCMHSPVMASWDNVQLHLVTQLSSIPVAPRVHRYDHDGWDPGPPCPTGKISKHMGKWDPCEYLPEQTCWSKRSDLFTAPP